MNREVHVRICEGRGLRCPRLLGEGIREPLRIRAGWVPDEVIKQLEAFVTPGCTAVRTLPAGMQGGAAA